MDRIHFAQATNQLINSFAATMLSQSGDYVKIFFGLQNFFSIMGFIVKYVFTISLTSSGQLSNFICFSTGRADLILKINK